MPFLILPRISVSRFQNSQETRTVFTTTDTLSKKWPDFYFFWERSSNIFLFSLTFQIICIMHGCPVIWKLSTLSMNKYDSFHDNNSSFCFEQSAQKLVQSQKDFSNIHSGLESHRYCAKLLPICCWVRA